MTKDLLETIQKTEFTTTAAREDHESRPPPEGDELPLRVMTPVFKLAELVCSWRSKKKSDSKDESNLGAPA